MWYKFYIDYHGLHETITDFKNKEESNQVCKLPGIYYYSIVLMKPVCLSFDLEKREESTASSSTTAVLAIEKKASSEKSRSVKGAAGTGE